MVKGGHSARRANYALRRSLAAVCAVFILVVAIGVPAAIIAPVPEAHASVVPDAERTLAAAEPDFASFGSSAVGVVGMDGVLATHGDQSPQAIASITKVVTALVVLEKKPLTGDDAGPTITYTQKDVAIYDDVIAQDGSHAAVQAGWKLSERDSLTAMMLPSANNYAESLVDWAYGSVPAFLTAAKAFLAAHDLDHTTLVDSNGLDPRDVSTPSDLIALGKIALADPVVSAIVAEQTDTVPQIGELMNTNALLGSHGIDGIKTGTGNDDGSDANLLFSATAKVGTRTVQIVGVVLDAPSHPALDSTVPALLTSVQQGLHDVQLAASGQSFGTYHTRWGYTARAVAGSSASMLVWGTHQVEREADVRAIRGGTKGERVGSVTYRVGSATVSVPLELDRNVLAAPVWWRLTHPLR